MIEFRAERPIWNDSLELYARETIDGKTFALVAVGIERKEVEQGLLWPKFLSISLHWDMGQSLFQALWDAGYRPNKGEGTAAHVEATKAHLEDMRRLVFDAAVERSQPKEDGPR